MCRESITYLVYLGIAVLVQACQAATTPVPQPTAVVPSVPQLETATATSTSLSQMSAKEPIVVSDISLGVQGVNPAWDRDGKGMIYLPLVPGQEPGINRVSLDGREETLRAPDSLGGYLTDRVAVAIDSSLAFGGVVEGRQGIWILESIEADPKPVIISDFGKTFYVGEPSWSPDASRLAFTYTRVEWLDHGHRDVPSIWVVNRDGTHQQKLVDGDYPAWSPDGNTILFVRLPNPPSRQGAQVYLMDIDGSHQQKLVDGDHPAWSPDGQWIVYFEQGGLHVLNVRTRKSWRIAETKNGSSSWSPDGTRIAYVSDQPQPNTLRVLELEMPR